MIPDLWVTLFYVEETIPQALRSEMEKTPESYVRLQALEERIAQRTRHILEWARQRLLEQGLDPAKLDLRPPATGHGPGQGHRL